MGKEAKARAERRALPGRALAKKIGRVQRIVNYRIGPKAVAAYQGAAMTGEVLARIRGFVLRGLRELQVDTAGLEIYPRAHGSKLELQVGPWAPLVVGRENT